MKHYGDITKLSGYELPFVDVITGGSPCQDLSVAGKRAGLAGERSGLFMEQIRIVKEMRERDRRNGRTGVFVRPRYMVWENVPGAFSSNGGKDFQAVLEEICKIEQPDAIVTGPPNGKWSKSGCIVGDGFSVAWRVHDAQFWGVPQRRKRIALVADFGGLSAPEILFERKGVSGDSEPSGTAREETARAVRDGVESASGFGETGVGYWQPGIQTLRAEGENRPSRPGNVIVDKSLNGWILDEDDLPVCPRCEKVALQRKTFNTESREFGVRFELSDYCPFCGEAIRRSAMCAGFLFGQSGKARSIGYQEEVSPTLRGGEGGNQKPCVYDARGNGDGEIAPTMTGDHQNRVTDYTAIVNTYQDVTGTLNMSNYPIQNSIVRRLTPLECERLQGYPDGWTDIGEWTDSKGKKHKEADSPRYKALGNSIALPFWQFLARRICAQYERDITMASLFDGIGGFPLVFERCGAKAVWASEIEEFPIAVTKRHFPE